jgi:hypothetical protein
MATRQARGGDPPQPRVGGVAAAIVARAPEDVQKKGVKGNTSIKFSMLHGCGTIYQTKRALNAGPVWLQYVGIVFSRLRNVALIPTVMTTSDSQFATYVTSTM